MTAPTTRRTPVEAVQAWTDALHAGDADGVAAAFTPDGVLTDHGTGTRAEGTEDLRAGAAGFFALLSDLRFDKSVRAVGDGGYVAEWVLTAVHTGDLPGIPATGRTVRVSGAGVGEVRDGLVADAREYWNMADLLAQVGALPAQ